MDRTIAEILQIIDDLNNQVNTFRPLNKEQELRLLQKIRLDWNYHSCNIEGNMLTYGETKDLLFWGITAKGKPFKDHIELKGHNQAVEWIFDIVKDKNRPLNETFIRQLHSLIIAPDSYSDAQTPEGLPIKKLILRGEYKKIPNHVLTKTGEMFYFANPEETPAMMYDLIEWFKKTFDENKTHPLILASLFHYKFVRIHPFDDGNGRMSRILMNFILMMSGLPPVIIPTNEKSDYIQALELADYENIDSFIKYIGEKLIASLELVLKAAKGESIEEEVDLDKMLSMIDKRLEGISESQGLKTERTVKVQINLFERCFKPLNNILFPKLEKFNKYFNNTSISIQNDHQPENVENLTALNSLLKSLLITTDYSKFLITYSYSVLLKLGLVNYTLSVNVFIQFEQWKYKVGFGYIENNEFKPICKFEKLYHQILYSDEIQTASKQLVDYIISKIETEIGKIENGKNGI